MTRSLTPVLLSLTSLRPFVRSLPPLVHSATTFGCERSVRVRPDRAGLTSRLPLTLPLARWVDVRWLRFERLCLRAACVALLLRSSSGTNSLRSGGLGVTGIS
ncbi:hypothetical protein [Methanospirillum sp.]